LHPPDSHLQNNPVTLEETTVEMDITPISDQLVKVTLNGRLDAPAVDRIETRFTAALVPAALNAIVDLTKVDFVASMGIRMLLMTARNLKTRKARMALFGAPSSVNLVFETVALSQIIPICTTEAEALAAVGAGS
jgi:anti-anti-sigma factor